MAKFRDTIRQDIWRRWEASGNATEKSPPYRPLPSAFEIFEKLEVDYLLGAEEPLLSPNELMLLLSRKETLAMWKSEWNESLETANRLIEDSRFNQLDDIDKANSYSSRLLSCMELGLWPQVWENLTQIAGLRRFLVVHHVRSIVLEFPADNPAPVELSRIFQRFLNERKSYVRLAIKIIPGVTTNAQILELLNRTVKPEYRRTHAEWTALRSHQPAIAPDE